MNHEDIDLLDQATGGLPVAGYFTRWLFRYEKYVLGLVPAKCN